MKRTLIVMVKEPRPGRVKTRLGREIGMVAAAWWFRHQTRRLIRRLQDPRWELVLAVSPDVAGLQSRVWPEGVVRWPQGFGTLGDRMARMLAECQGGPACLIGADIPGVQPHHVAAAFAQLGSHDAVFGPAPDGGYWLIGLKHPKRQRHGFLQGVRWSTSHALEDSVASMPDHRVAMGATLRDVDTADDLRMTRPWVRDTP